MFVTVIMSPKRAGLLARAELLMMLVLVVLVGLIY
jgi:hypothetical protein